MAVLEQYHTGTIRLMGTVIELKIAHPEGERLVDEVFEQLKRYEHRFSANDPTSELMAVNFGSWETCSRCSSRDFSFSEIGTGE